MTKSQAPKIKAPFIKKSPSGRDWRASRYMIDYNEDE